MATTQEPVRVDPTAGDTGDDNVEAASWALSATVPLALAGIAEIARAARGNPEELERLLNRSLYPMFTADADRCYIEVNRPARLLFRRTLSEMRKLRIDDLTPPEGMPVLEIAWNRLVTTGTVAGSYLVGFPDGSRLEVVYWAVAYALRARHLIVFAPANWSEHELSPSEAAGPHDPAVELTPRELEVLRLAAMGNSAARMADLLVIGESTVKTHLANIYAKLGVSDRAAAVAIAIRIGLID